jgi:hypothetical protein
MERVWSQWLSLLAVAVSKLLGFCVGTLADKKEIQARMKEEMWDQW